MAKLDDKIIMGIDPGTNISGYGIIGTSGNKMELITYGVINMSKMGADHPAKLKKIFERTLSLIEEFKPDEVAIEAPFFGKNVQSMLKLGRAQGVAMAAALYRDVPITEYAPKKIKMAITGSGNAGKEQVAAMVERLLNVRIESKYLDASDGLAAAICHFLQNGKGSGFGGGTSKKSKGGSWGAFLKDNPGRLK